MVNLLHAVQRQNYRFAAEERETFSSNVILQAEPPNFPKSARSDGLLVKDRQLAVCIPENRWENTASICKDSRRRCLLSICSGVSHKDQRNICLYNNTKKKITQKGMLGRIEKLLERNRFLHCDSLKEVLRKVRNRANCLHNLIHKHFFKYVLLYLILCLFKIFIMQTSLHCK